MRLKNQRPLFLAIALFLIAPASQAASVYLAPANSTANLADGSVVLELFMDFTDDATLGGGVDFALSGPIAVGGFTPSTFFTDTADPAFSGFGTTNADADFEVHFGDFGGLSGVNKLGDLEISLLGLGPAAIDLAINSAFGDFFSTEGSVQTVDLLGAQIQIVPVPAALWLMGSALGVLAGLRRRRLRG